MKKRIDIPFHFRSLDFNGHPNKLPVLDEVDRMLDCIQAQISNIIEQIRRDEPDLMWSATCPREVQQLATEVVRTA